MTFDHVIESKQSHKSVAFYVNLLGLHACGLIEHNYKPDHAKNQFSFELSFAWELNFARSKCERISLTRLLCVVRIHYIVEINSI